MKRASLSPWVIFIALIVLSQSVASEVLLGSAIASEIDAQEKAQGGQQGSFWLSLSEPGKQPSVIDAKPGIYDVFVRVSPSFPEHVVLHGNESVKLTVTGEGVRKFPIDLKSIGLNEGCCADNHKYLQLTYMVPSSESEPEVGISAAFQRILAERPGGVTEVDQSLIFLNSLDDAYKYYNSNSYPNYFRKWRKYSWLDKAAESFGAGGSSSVVVKGVKDGSIFSVNTNIDVSRSAEIRIQLNQCASGAKIQAIFENAEKSFPVPLIIDRANYIKIPLGPIKARAALANGGDTVRLRKIIAYSDLSVADILACHPLRELETFTAVDPALRSAALITPESRVFDLGAGVRVLRVPLDSISDRADWGRLLQSLDVVVRPAAGVAETDLFLLNVSFVDPMPGELMPPVSACGSLPRDYPSGVRPFTLGPCPVWVRSFNFGGLDPTPSSGEGGDLNVAVSASGGVRYRMDHTGLTSVTFSLKGADDWLTVSVLPAALQRPSQPAALELVFDPQLQVTTADNKIVRPGLFFFSSPQDLKFRITKPEADAQGSGGLYKFIIRYAGGNVSGVPVNDAKVKEYCLNDSALQVCQAGSLENLAVGDAGLVFTGPSANILRASLSGVIDLPEKSAVQVLGDAEGNSVKMELDLITADNKLTHRVLNIGEIVPLFGQPTSVKEAVLKIIPPDGKFRVSLQSVNFLAMAPDVAVSPLNVVYSVSRSLSLPVDGLTLAKGVEVQAERGGLNIRRLEAPSVVEPIVQWSSKSPVSVSELSSLIVGVQGDSYNPSHMSLEIEATIAGKMRLSRYEVNGRDKLTIPKSEILPPSPDGATVPTFVFRLFAEPRGKPSIFPTVLTLHALANVARPGRDLASLFPIVGVGGREFYLNRNELDVLEAKEYPNWIKLGRVELKGSSPVVRGNNPIFRATDLLLDPVK
ncbi:hypothetical protein [Roseixanthobacter glucoisosaccharinicivorans]|uniref:hypothetical protein n=1 Tax=Roseixanthobacter glucoisosaccharinicivorans TaxID=3119923 RepID=UPI0037288C48